MTTPSPPLSSGLRAFAIIGIIVGVIATLMTLVAIGQTAYVLAGGQPVGAAATRRLMESMGGPDSAMVRRYDAQMAAQVEAQKEWAPFQLATHIPYAVGVAGLSLAALLLVLGREVSRRWLVRFAILACVTRLGVGFVAYQLAARPMSQAFQNGISAGFEEDSARQSRTPKDEAARERAQRLGASMGRVGLAMVAATTLMMTLVISGLWAAMAWVFRPRRLPTEGVAPTPG